MAKVRGSFVQAMAPGLRHQVLRYMTSPSAWFISSYHYNTTVYDDLVDSEPEYVRQCTACGDLFFVGERLCECNAEFTEIELDS